MESGWLAWTLAALIATALSGVCLTLAFLPDETSRPHRRHVALPDALVACATDADCVMVDRIGCCTCQTGGAQWAVATTQTDALRRFLKRACKEQPACLQIDACRRDLAATCRDARCRVAITTAPPADEGGHG